MLEYFALCFFCIVCLSIVLYDETAETIENAPFLTKFSIIIFSIPLVPVFILIYVIIKVIRND